MREGTPPDRLPRILFVCTGNAGRSQIAQAMFRRLAAGRAEVESAGVRPWKDLHPMAVRIMAGRGEALKGHFPKPVSTAARPLLDVVVTIGSVARDLIPATIVNATRWVHWDIADPADADGRADSEAVFLRTADEIERRLPRLLDLVASMHPGRANLEKPGIATCLWAPGRLEPSRHLPEVARAGFGAIELGLFFGKAHFDDGDPRAVRELKRVLEDLGLVVWSIHSPDLGSLAASDKAVRDTQLDALRSNVRLAEDLGAKVVISHGLLIAPRNGDPARDDAALCEGRFSQALEELAPELEPSPVCIAFENGYVMKPGFWGRDVLKMVHRNSRPAFGFVLDTGHARIAGDGAEIATMLGERLISLHLNDNDGKADSHLVPGEGKVDWASVASTIRAASYSGCMMYEILSGGRNPRDVLGAVMAAHRERLAPACAWKA